MVYESAQAKTFPVNIKTREQQVVRPGIVHVIYFTPALGEIYFMHLFYVLQQFALIRYAVNSSNTALKRH